MGSDAAKDLGRALGLKEDFEDLDQSFAPLVAPGDSCKAAPAGSAPESVLSPAATFVTGRQYSAGEGSGASTSRSISSHSQAAEGKSSEHDVEEDEAVGANTPKPEMLPPKSDVSPRDDGKQTEESENDM